MSLRHRDAFGRVKYVDQTSSSHEHYLRPNDGRLAPLRVQGTDNAYGYGQRTWERNGRPRSRVSAILHLAHWTYSPVLVEGTEERRYDSGTIPTLALRWIPSCLILAVLLLIPQNLEGVFKNGGFYDPVQYQDWRYPKVSRNPKEGQLKSPRDKDAEESKPLLEGEGDIEMKPQLPPRPPMIDERIDEEFDDLPARHFRPRYLCFLQDGPRGPDTEYVRRKVTDWIQDHGDFASTDFVLISYTRHHFLVSADQKWRNKPEPDAETKAKYEQQAHEDRGMVLAYGMEAARAAGKRAFWVDFECIRDKEGDEVRGHVKNDDVYRISDIVRAAHSLVILVGPPHDSRPPGQPQENSYSPAAMTEWLQHWGSRLWTLPEILLCSPERRIKLYAVGGPNPPEEIAKRNVAARCVWSDAKQVRELVDHYESSIHLTPLELVSGALECFSTRQTDQFSGGDIAYALMGLLRRRPAVVTDDTSFEAFARLSLANDSDKLLERLICMQPTRRDAPWHKIRDAWNVRLWDIEPRCQVAGIVDDQTVTLDGAFGATIQWDAMEQVAFLKRPTASRLIGKILLRGVPAYLILGLALTILGGVFLAEADSASDSDGSSASPSVASSGAAAALLAPGLIFLIPAAIITLLIPVMLLNIYQGKFWSVQAHFLGLEGIPNDIGEIERILFGFNHGRLKWSVAGSPLSRNGLSENGERVGHPPAKSAHPQDRSYDKGLQPETERAEKETVFTLIDTYAMTATAFRAARPPTAVIVCGHEGGMQRAILCSYDWQEGTFVREAVIRVKTLVLDRMFRIDRFRFALNRKAHRPAKSIGSSTDAARHGPTHERDGFWDRWKIDLCLLPFMFLVYGVYTVNNAGGDHPLLWIELYHVAFLLVQPLNFVLFRKMHMGNLVGVAALIKGIIAIILNFVTGKSASLALNFIFGLADGILAPAFVYLTGLWYEGAWGRMIRIVIWASGYNFFAALPSLSSGGIYPLALSWAIICVLLAGYAFSFLGTPEQALWLWESQRSSSSATRPWQRNGSSFKVLTLFKDVQTYFFIATFLSVAAFDSCNLNYVDSTQLPAVTLVFLFPLILVLFLGVFFTKFRYTQLPITAIVVSLSFVGKIELAHFGRVVRPGALADGLFFLQMISGFAVFLTWALLVTDMVEPQALLGTLCIAFAAYGLGRIIVGALLATASYRELFYRRPHVPGFEIVLYLFFALALTALLTWSAYRFRNGRNGRASPVSPAGEYHQQVDEQPFDHDVDNSYRSPSAVASKQSQGVTGSYDSPDRLYARGRGSV
ncbi:hypothetical protein F5Y18DRAFT_373766 [Xylariaceae sp. FL1019]|nr:hypothetical protein F5Y18DRAFT_373766 [Xylariaceae sp. FL1019]